VSAGSSQPLRMRRLHDGLRCRKAVALSGIRAMAPPIGSMAMNVCGDGTRVIASMRTSMSSSLSSSAKLAFQ
jgi:hypothetical protein